MCTCAYNVVFLFAFIQPLSHDDGDVSSNCFGLIFWYV